MKVTVKRLNESDMLTESSLSRLWETFKTHDIGIITTNRSELTSKENSINNKILMGKLKSEGYGIIKVKGYFIENYMTDNPIKVKEESLLVVDNKDSGNLKKKLIRYGMKFNQDSVLFQSVETGIAELVGTKTDAYPGLGVSEELGKPLFGVNGEFYSRVNGRPFIFA